MSGLGLRYCQQHAGEPLLLVVRGKSAWWACEINQCAYTEDVIRDGTSVIAVNGRALRTPVKQSLNRRTKRGR